MLIAQDTVSRVFALLERLVLALEKRAEAEERSASIAHARTVRVGEALDLFELWIKRQVPPADWPENRKRREG